LNGDLIMTVTASSPTFVREYNHQFSVIENPFTIESLVNENNTIKLGVSVDTRVFDRDKTTIQIGKGADQQALALAEGLWQIELPADKSASTVAVTINSVFHQGKDFQKTIDYKLPAVAKIVEKEKPAEPIAETIEKEPVKPEPIVEPPAETVAKEAPKEESTFSWIVVFIGVLVVNLVLIGIGYFVYKKYFSNKKTESDDDMFALNDSESGSENNNEDDADSIADLEDMDEDDSASKSKG
jgi:hypothetical protein